MKVTELRAEINRRNIQKKTSSLNKANLVEVLEMDDMGEKRTSVDVLVQKTVKTPVKKTAKNPVKKTAKTPVKKTAKTKKKLTHNNAEYVALIICFGEETNLYKDDISKGLGEGTSDLMRSISIDPEKTMFDVISYDDMIINNKITKLNEENKFPSLKTLKLLLELEEVYDFVIFEYCPFVGSFISEILMKILHEAMKPNGVLVITSNVENVGVFPTYTSKNEDIVTKYMSKTSLKSLGVRKKRYHI
jgi:hypothetical protein